MILEDSKPTLVTSIHRGNREFEHPKSQLVKPVNFNLGLVEFVATSPNLNSSDIAPRGLLSPTLNLIFLFF